MPKSKSKKAPFVSVVVALYNADRFLNQCVDSILNQTYRDFELILVDDGSSDDSPQICDGYAKIDKRVKVIHQKNGGQTVARQNGLKIAKGEYVLIFDSDDWLELNALGVMVKSAIGDKADIVTFNGYFEYAHHNCRVKQPAKSGVFDREGLKKYIYPTMIYSGRFFYFGIFAAMWNKLFRRSLITPDLMAVDPRVKIFEDGLATFACFLDAERVVVLGDEYLYHYRDNMPSITRSYCPDQFKSTLVMIDTLNGINRKRLNIFDLSDQIDYYYLYALRCIIIEEFYYRYSKSFLKRYRYLKEIVNHQDVGELCKRTSLDDKNIELRSFHRFLGKKNVPMLIMLAVIRAYHMRAKVYARRKLNRY